MNEVWILGAGEYSDYHVVGVFSSEENVLRHIAKYASEKEYYRWNDFSWDKYTVDDKPMAPKHMYPYIVIMDMNGNTSHVTNMPWPKDGGGTFNSISVTTREGSTDKRIVAKNIWAKDENHAVKIVNEIRAKIIGNNFYFYGRSTTILSWDEIVERAVNGRPGV